MAHPNIPALRATIADLETRLVAMPSPESHNSSSWETSWDAYRNAENEIAEHLRIAYGARIAHKGYTNTIRMHGISSSCTSGLTGLFRNWLRAAESKAAAQ